MNVFRLSEWWRYRRAAKGRHGVHSPFVYRFIEEALRPPFALFTWPVLPYVDAGGGPTVWRSNNLMRRVLRYFDFRRIAIIHPGYTGVEEALIMRKHEPTEPEKIPFRRSLQPLETLYNFNGIGSNILPPQDWLEQYAALLPGLGGLDVIAVHNIHQSPAHAAAWKDLCAQPDVRMSIDLFASGLLFFNPDFKVRQHFVLKYP